MDFEPANASAILSGARSKKCLYVQHKGRFSGRRSVTAPHASPSRARADWWRAGMRIIRKDARKAAIPNQ